VFFFIVFIIVIIVLCVKRQKYITVKNRIFSILKITCIAKYFKYRFTI